MGYRWKPSKTAAKEFAIQMKEIEEYCRENNISRSISSDSYYFTHDGIDYRVSNHAVEKSVDRYGDSYHGNSKEYRKNTFCIHAGKTRIIEIHKAIVSGKNVDHKGNIIY